MTDIELEELIIELKHLHELTVIMTLKRVELTFSRGDAKVQFAASTNLRDVIQGELYKELINGLCKLRDFTNNLKEIKQ